jgi:orotate phosphoribosyltransferase
MKNITYINAGAGSGKTYTLTEKMCELITQKKCSVSEVIMTTFTEKAAADLRLETKEKLLSNNKIQEAAQIDCATIGTVHSIAFKYIKRYWYKLGISASVATIDEAQKADIIGKLEKGQKVVVVEDLISTGGSVIEVVESLRDAGADVLGVVSIFTYGMKKGLERLEAANVKNVSLSNFDAVVEVAAETGYIKPEDKERLIAFRNNPSDESWIK